jgi:hypothetical protein
MQGFDHVFRMRHHADDVAVFADDAGDVVQGAVGIAALAYRNTTRFRLRGGSVSASQM